MDARPHEIRAQIARTRASLDTHLDQLDAQIGETGSRLSAAVQRWGAVGVAAGLAAAIVIFWRRQGRTPERRLRLAPPAV